MAYSFVSFKASLKEDRNAKSRARAILASIDSASFDSVDIADSAVSINIGSLCYRK